MKHRTTSILILLLINALAIIASLQGNIIASLLQNRVNPVILVVSFLVISTIILAYQVTEKIRETAKAEISEDVRRRNREKILSKVKFYWINSFLEEYLNANKYIPLDFDYSTTKARRLLPRSHAEMSLSGQDASQFDIAELFQNSAGEMIILGPPGAGKTVLLLTLAKKLVEQAVVDGEKPIPLVLGMSSWSIKYKTFEDWLVSELQLFYKVPEKTVQDWLSRSDCMLLLDGLDEVPLEWQMKCIDSLNVFRSKHGFLPIVITCRLEEYKSFQKQLDLNTVLVIRPLSTRKIEEYLQSQGVATTRLLNLYNNDAEIRELLKTPLMLSLFAAINPSKLPSKQSRPRKVASIRRDLFNEYIKAMISSRASSQFSINDTIKWIIIFARNAKRHNITVLYVDRIQPSWLLTTVGRQYYYYFLALLMGGYVFTSTSLYCNYLLGLNFGLGIGLISGTMVFLIIGVAGEMKCFLDNNAWHRKQPLLPNIKWGFIGALGVGFGFYLMANLVYMPIVSRSLGVVGGIVYGVIWFIITQLGLFVEKLISRRFIRLPRNKRITLNFRQPYSFAFSLVASITHAVVLSLFTLFAACLYTSLLLDSLQGSLINIAVTLAAFLLVLISHFPFVWLVLSLFIYDIRPFDGLRWSMKRGVRVGLLWGLTNAVVWGSIAGILASVTTSSALIPIASLSTAFVMFIFSSTLYWIGGGFEGKEIEKRFHPNEGVIRSARNSLWGVLTGFLVGFPFVILQEYFRSLVVGIDFVWFQELNRIAVLASLYFGSLLAIITGLGAFIQHISLRLTLRLMNEAPLNFITFLNYLVSASFIRRTGSGYLFFHRLFLEHVASLNDREENKILDDLTEH